MNTKRTGLVFSLLMFIGICFIGVTSVFASDRDDQDRLKKYVIPSFTSVSDLNLCIKKNGQIFFFSGNRESECGRSDRFIALHLGGTGSSGSVGATGATGSSGLMGPTGLQGLMGPSGIGDTGATGAMGPSGVQGVIGQTGPIGSTGPKGLDGEDGLPGQKGDSGETGPTGMQGATGVQGQNGQDGSMGPTGPSGSGETGATGAVGATGAQGMKGDAGVSGVNGISNWERVVGTYSADDESQKTVSVDCSAGKKLLGGGFVTEDRSNSGKISVAFNGPLDDDTWQIIAGVDGTTTSGDESFSIAAVVMCADVQ